MHPKIRKTLDVVLVTMLVLAAGAIGHAQDRGRGGGVAGIGNCGPDSTGQGCQPTACPVPGDECVPTAVVFSPSNGTTTVVECVCLPPMDCHIEIGNEPAPPCVQPDNGAGTVDLPPDCEYSDPDDQWRITGGGLPAGTIIVMDGVLNDFTCVNPPCTLPPPPGPPCESPGGDLGGDYHCFRGLLTWQMQGTGALAGFMRTLFVPVELEVHTAPRSAGDPIQTFATQMVRIEGQLIGDPDFDLIRLRGGQSFGHPSPGETTLHELLGGVYSVDSFFDVSYEIEWEGAPGSILDGLGGTSAASVLIQTGGANVDCIGTCPAGTECVEQIVALLPNGMQIICDCQPLEPDECAPDPTTGGCIQACPAPGLTCITRCANYDPATGAAHATLCECIDDDNACRLEAVPPAGTCIEPDNGSGTITMPPQNCEYTHPGDLWVLQGNMPAGTTIEFDATLKNPSCVSPNPPLPPGCPPLGTCEQPGGVLGGDRHCYTATLEISVSGTNTLAFFNRTLFVPVAVQVDTAQRVLGDPVQPFDMEIQVLTGDLFGDPDFCTLQIDAVAGSPGHTILANVGGSFAVDSFFDVTFQVTWQGCPGSPLDGLQGIDVDTVRLRTGGGGFECVGNCPPGTQCEQQVTVLPDGTIDICCECIPIEPICETAPGAFGCLPIACPTAGEECMPTCAVLDPASGQTIASACDCIDPLGCRLVPAFAGPPCVAPDDGNGTTQLPPPGCEYHSEDPWRIADGLPAGATIDIDAILKDFFNVIQGAGGSLGGEFEQYQAVLEMPMQGTGVLGGFVRNMSMIVDVETHSATRSSGDPIQSFDTEMIKLDGSVFGDPDFDSLRIEVGVSQGLPPAPGHTTLAQLPSTDFNVDSFFDVEYRIQFQGAPGSALDSLSGTTVGTTRIVTGGNGVRCDGPCPPRFACREQITVHTDGSIETCCECVLCPGDTNGDGVVNVDDLNNVILDWGTDGSGHGGDIAGPLPGDPPDGIVDVNDLNAVIVGWGPCP